MTPPAAAPRALRAGLLLLAALLLQLLFRQQLWGDSVDQAHHYALVVRLIESGQSAFPLDASLGEMNFYPRGAHQLAALAGRMAGSAIVGLQRVTVLSLTLVWALPLLILLDLPARAARAAAAALLLLLLLNQSTLRLQLHGEEVLGAFFLPQLLGQALCFGALLAVLRLERAGLAPWPRLALLVPAVWLLTGVHLMPALFLLACLAGLLGVELLRRRGGAGLLGAAGAAAALLLAGCAALLGHPAFAAMLEISKNNGGLPIRHFAGAAALAAYAGAIALLSLLLLACWARRRADAARWLALKYLALYGLAVAGMCLLQWLALLLGHGSDYAVRKYGFALNTAALFELALLPALLLRRPDAPPRAALADCLLPAALTALAVCAVSRGAPAADLADLRALEAGLLALRRDAVPAPPPGRHVYVAGLRQNNPVLEYAMSIALFRMPRSGNAAGLLSAGQLGDWSTVDSVLSAEDGPFDRPRACRRAPPAGGLVALDGQCLLAAASDGRRRLLFDASKGVHLCTLTGFSGGEQQGTWSEARQASLSCPRLRPGGAAASRVELQVFAFLGGGGRQRAVVSVDGLAPRRLLFDAGHPGARVALALDPAAAGPLLIRFSLPDAASPQQLGLGGDTRQLGLNLQWLEFH